MDLQKNECVIIYTAKIKKQQEKRNPFSIHKPLPFTEQLSIVHRKVLRQMKERMANGRD
jgi:hypothetical protein